MKIIDTHCHLHREEFEADREAVIARAKEAGVGAFIDPATTLASNWAVVSEAQRYPEVYAAIGIHPHDVAEATPDALQQLKTFAEQPKVVAIGEVGLDYYREISPRDLQKKVLRELFSLAKSTGLPVIIHCRGQGAAAVSAGEGREVFQDLFALMKEIFKPPVRGLLHCFSGDLESAQEAIEMGLYLSFAGNLTFTKAEPLRAVAKVVPFDRVVLETDAPFLAPQAHRGKRNEPSYLQELVKTWSGLRGLSEQEVIETTALNTMRVFGLKEPTVSGA